MTKKTKVIVPALLVILVTGAALIARNRYPVADSDVVLGKYKELESKIEIEETTDEDIQAVLDSITEQAGVPFIEAPEGTVIEEGDKVSITYFEEGDGKENSSQGEIVIGSSEWQQEFSDTLMGLKKSSEAEVVISDEDHEHSYHLTVDGIKTRGDITDDYVKTLGIEGVETKVQLYEDIKKYCDDVRKANYEAKLKTYLEEEIVKSSKIKAIPGELKEKYKNELESNIEEVLASENRGIENDEEKVTRQSLLLQAMDEEGFEGTPDEYMVKKINDKCKTYLVMKKIAEKEGIEVDLDKLYSNIALDWRNSGTETLSEYLKTHDRETYERQLLIDTVLDYLITCNS